MCIVSAVSDDYMKKWPDPFQPSVLGGTYISWVDYEEYQRLKRMAEELDRALKQADCVKPEVDEWEQKVRQALKNGGLMS